MTQGDGPTTLSPILGMTTDANGEWQHISFFGAIAVYDYQRHDWSNNDDPIHPTNVRGRWLQGDNLIHLARPIGRVRRDHAPAFVGPDFEPIKDGMGSLMLSFEAVEKSKDGKWVPAYFEIGFRQEAGNELVQLSEDEVKNALDGGGGDAIVVTDPTLQLVRFNGEDANGGFLEQRAKATAEKVLAGSGTQAKLLSGRGWQKVELSGLVSKVTWDSQGFLTVAEVMNRWAPGGALEPSLYRERLDEDYPNQQRTESDRRALGAAGDRAPVQHLGAPPDTLPEKPTPFFPILVSVDNPGDPFVAGDQEHNCTFTYSLFDLAGNAIKNADPNNPANPPVAATKQTPAMRRYERIQYEWPSDKSLATAYLDQAGAVKLWEVAEEIATTTDCEESS